MIAPTAPARTAFIMLCAAAALLSACTRGDVPQADTAADSVGAASSGAETFFRYGLVDVGATREALAAKLGAPDSVTTRPFQNRHDSTQTDSILMIHYPGLAAEIYRVSANGNELTVSVRVSDNRYIAATAPVRIGMSAADVRTLMGAPSESAGGVMSYDCATCTALGNERIEVRLAGNRVSAVTVFHSID